MLIFFGEFKRESKKVFVGFYLVEVGLVGTIYFKEFYDLVIKK